MGVEAAVEAGEIAAQGEQFVELGEDLIVGEDVAAFLAGELVEGAVVALGDADVGVVDDAHQHVGAGCGRVEAGAYLGGEAADVRVAGFAPQQEGFVGRDAGLSGIGGVDPGADVGERGGRGQHRLILVLRDGPTAHGAERSHAFLRLCAALPMVAR